MASSDLVKDFISQLEPEDVPFEYIAAASIRDINGKELMLQGEQLKMLMNNHPDYSYVKDARIFLNINQVMKDITLEVEYIFERVDILLREESMDEDAS